MSGSQRDMLLALLRSAFPVESPPQSASAGGGETPIPDAVLWTDLESGVLEGMVGAMPYLTPKAFRYYIPGLLLLAEEALPSKDGLVLEVISYLDPPGAFEHLEAGEILAVSGSALDVAEMEALGGLGSTDFRRYEEEEFRARVGLMSAQQRAAVDRVLRVLASSGGEIFRDECMGICSRLNNYLERHA